MIWPWLNLEYKSKFKNGKRASPKGWLNYQTKQVLSLVPVSFEDINEVKKRLNESDEIPDVPSEPLKAPTPHESPIKNWFTKKAFIK